jgi:hypothetical protein
MLCFEQFGKNYHIEGVEKGKHYVAKHTKAHKREKWNRVEFQVKMVDGGEFFERECGSSTRVLSAAIQLRYSTSCVSACEEICLVKCLD